MAHRCVIGVDGGTEDCAPVSSISGRALAFASTPYLTAFRGRLGRASPMVGGRLWANRSQGSSGGRIAASDVIALAIDDLLLIGRLDAHGNHSSRHSSGWMSARRRKPKRSAPQVMRPCA